MFTDHLKAIDKWMKMLVTILVAIFIGFNFPAISHAGILSIPQNTEIIEESAFEGDGKIIQVKFQEGLRIINSRAFADTNISLAIIPESVTYIAEDAFNGIIDMAVQTPTNSYAYSWALRHGFRIISENEIDSILHKFEIVSDLKAGEDIVIDVEIDINEAGEPYYIAYRPGEEFNYYTRLHHEKMSKTTIPGYYVENGLVSITIGVMENLAVKYRKEFPITITGERPNGGITVIPDKYTVKSDEMLSISLNRPINEPLCVRVRGKNTDYDIYETGSDDSLWIYGHSNDFFLEEGKDTGEFFIEACYKMDGCWTSWSDPVTIVVTRSENE